MKNIYRFTLISAALLFYLNCVPEAPHSNPLDPYRANTAGTGIELFGQTLQKNEPHLPIDSCLVLISPGNIFRLSNPNGEFRVPNLQPGVYQLIFNRERFATDTFRINTDTLSQAQVHFYLNGLPSVQKFRIYSEFIDQWWPDPFYTVNFSLIAGDIDGTEDLIKKEVRIPELNISAEFAETSRPDSFFVQLTDRDLPNNDIFALIGKPVYVVLEDQSQAAANAGPFQLVRVIATSPDSLSPTGLESVAPQPIFTWKPYTANFDFTYEISVFVINTGIPILIHSVTGIPVEQNSYSYPDSLPSGKYFWTVGVRDEMGNLSRSKEAAFLVE